MVGRLAFLKWPVAASVAALMAAWIYRGSHALWLVAILIVLETSLSFDNAVINAGVLRHLSSGWQRAFLTIGVLIAVFGMRLLFPILIVAIASSQPIRLVAVEAWRQPDTYAKHVEAAAPMIGGFGGTFLLMLALSFLLAADRERHWIAPVERLLGDIGRFPSAPVLVTLVTLLLTARVVARPHQHTALVAGLLGITVFLAVRGVRDRLEHTMHASNSQPLTGAAAMASFVYLETLDASFSLDGVLGAFAISSDIVVVALGLGAGAVYVRSLTVHLVRHQALRQFPYLTHGAHWAIGALGIFLLISIERHPPEWLTAGVSVGFIVAAWISSLSARRAMANEFPASAR